MPRPLVLVFALVLTACTQQPRMRPVTPYPTDFSDIVLRDNLSVRDVKQIFVSINRNHRLDALKPYLETPPDSELEPFIGVINRQVYQQTSSARGLVQALQTDSRDRAFSAWEKTARAIALGAEGRDRIEAVLFLLSQPEFARVAARDSAWLDPDWIATLAAAWEKAKNEYTQSAKPHQERKTIPVSSVLSDLHGLLDDKAAREILVARGQALLKSGIALPLLRTAAYLRRLDEKHPTAAFEGFSYGLADFLTQRLPEPIASRHGKLDALLQLVEDTDGPPGGLFASIQKRLLTDRDTIGQAAEMLQPIFLLTVLSSLKESLGQSDKTGKTFWLGLVPQGPGRPGTSFHAFFDKASKALMEVTGPERVPGDPDELLVDWRIYLNAYAMTKWAESTAIANQKAWESLPSQGFERKIWSITAACPAFSLDLLNENNQVSDQALSDLEKAGLPHALSVLRTATQLPGTGNLRYEFADSPSASLEEAAKMALFSIDTTRRIAEAGPFVQALVYGWIRPDASGKSLFDSLESTENLLTMAQQFLGGLPPEGWQHIKHWLGNGEVSEVLRELLLKFYPDPELKAKASRIFGTFPLFFQLDSPMDGLPSPFVFYQRLLACTDPDQKRALGSVLAFTSKQRVLAIDQRDDEWVPRFPGLHGLLADGGISARLLHALSWLPPSSHAQVQLLLEQALGDEGLGLHVDLLGRLLEEHQKGIEAWLRADADGDLGSAAPSQTRQWLLRFLGDADFPIAFNFLQPRTDRQSALKLVGELKRLGKNGELAEAFHLLDFIRNDRIRELAAALQAWESSGELAMFLSAMETLLQPVTPVASADFH